jgi:tetratricopeptide (TPR) repeat protein
MLSLRTAVMGLACTFFALQSAGVAAQEPAANDAEARVHYDAGQLYYDSERYDEALREFREAYRLSPRPALLYNQAAALDRLGRTEEAIALYQLYLDTDQDSPLQAEITERMGALRMAQDTEEQEGSAAPETVEPVRLEPDNQGGIPTSAIISLGIAGALVAGAITTGVLALGVHGDLTEECGEGAPCPAHLESEISRGEHLTWMTDILGALALMATAAGVTLWILNDEEDEGADVSLSASLGGLRLKVSF